MSMIEAICIAPEHGAAQWETEVATINESLGLVGDRHAGRSPVVVSFIAVEEVRDFNRRTGLAIEARHTGRNIVTRGVDLNALVGKRFTVAGVEFEGMELCEPCATLGARLATGRVGAPRVVREFTGKAVLRAYVKSGGEVRVGDAVCSCG